MNDQQVIALFERWNDTLQTGSPKTVSALYAENATLLPTISNQVRHNHSEIEDYFVDFLARGPRGIIDEANVRVFENIVINSGVYTFSFKDGSQVQARYTFVYQRINQEWKIIEHHSSAMPE